MAHIPDSEIAREPQLREQKLTVSGLYRPGWHVFPLREQVPLLQLAGPWLEKAGFYPGAQVSVRPEPGRLVVVLRGRDTDAVDGEGG